MEPEDPLLHSRAHARSPYPEPDIHARDPIHAPFHVWKIQFNIMHPSTPGSSKLSPSFISFKLNY